MKPTLQTAALLLALLAAPLLAAAQATPASPEQQATAYVQRLAPEIGLTPDQLPKVRQIVLTQRLEMAAASKAAHDGGDPAALRPAMKAARDKSEAALRGVLTPAQYAKYQQYMAARLGQLRVTSQTD